MMQIVVKRALSGVTVDEQGNPVTELSTHTLDGFRFAPGTPQESPDRVDVAGVLYGAFGVDVLATDLVEVAGVTYSVDGQPEHWQSGFGTQLSGCRIYVKRVA